MSFNEFQMHLDTQLNDGLSEFNCVFYQAMAKVTIKQAANMEGVKNVSEYLKHNFLMKYVSC